MIAAHPTQPTALPAPTTSDRRGRPLRDLRISVTDRCNFRCVYCMPKTVFGRDYPFLPRQDLLTYEEIVRLARLFAAQGVNKIRLTGGEPLLRRDIERLIEQLARIPDLELTLTTNGSLLAARARALRDAGLHRVTVSLDGLDDAVFKRMNDADYPVSRVLDGIEAAAHVGLAPVKINMVVKRGANDGEILPMARHFRGSGHILRFIEYMDAGNANAWQAAEVIPAADVVRHIDSEFPLEAIDPNYPGEVAERWRYRDGAGEIGVIASVTQAFCSGCTRVRLSTDGRVYTCLFASEGHDLRHLLRGNTDDAQLATAIAEIWRQRDDRYSELRGAGLPVAKKIEMSYIGG
jgi:cyclic pyranopterin phosphate synthase